MWKTTQATMVCLWLAALATPPASADYLTTSSGHVVRNSSGECVHIGYWSADQAIVGCDGKVAEVEIDEPAEFAAVEPIAEPEPPTIEQVTLDAETYFAFDKAELQRSATTKLDAVVSALQGYNDLLAVRISGHADRIGDASYNRDLAMERANTVASYLVGRGKLDPDLLTVVSQGESDPVVECGDRRGEALIDCLSPNRRVELDIEGTALR